MSNQEKKIVELKALVEGAEISLQQARLILSQLLGDENALAQAEARRFGSVAQTSEGQIIEGVFDGQNMLGPDGKKYSVPANYASKSKLVEGDKLKLTITQDGSFVYKQINLLERERAVGMLTVDEQSEEYRVLANGRSYKVLTASITYFKGEPGDKVTILLPKGKESSWAAVENVIKPDDSEWQEETAGAVVQAEQSLATAEPEGEFNDRGQAGEDALSQASHLSEQADKVADGDQKSSNERVQNFIDRMKDDETEIKEKNYGNQGASQEDVFIKEENDDTDSTMDASVYNGSRQNDRAGQDYGMNTAGQQDSLDDDLKGGGNKQGLEEI